MLYVDYVARPTFLPYVIAVVAVVVLVLLLLYAERFMYNVICFVLYVAYCMFHAVCNV